MNFNGMNDRLDDYLLPHEEDLEEFTIFDGDEGFYTHDEDLVFYDEWPTAA
jgi:hypothetical protein